jgi:hypothetical protein
MLTKYNFCEIEINQAAELPLFLNSVIFRGPKEQNIGDLKSNLKQTTFDVKSQREVKSKLEEKLEEEKVISNKAEPV